MLSKNKMKMYEAMNGGSPAWVTVFKAKNATEAAAIADSLQNLTGTPCKVEFETCVMVPRPNLPSAEVVTQAVESLCSC